MPRKTYDIYINIPDQKLVDEKQVEGKEQVLKFFREHPWDEQMRLFEQLENPCHHPSMAFDDVEGEHILDLAPRKQDKGILSFSVSLFYSIEKEVFLGMFAR